MRLSEEQGRRAVSVVGGRRGVSRRQKIREKQIGECRK